MGFIVSVDFNVAIFTRGFWVWVRGMIVMSARTHVDGEWVLHLERWDQRRFSIFCYVKHTRRSLY